MRFGGRCSHISTAHATCIGLLSSPPRRFGTSNYRASCVTSVSRHASIFDSANHPSRNSYSMTSLNALPEHTYIPEIDLEAFEDYRPGGYHPIVIGDTFDHGRYRVVHKLGFGGYSTIWLARDNTRDRYVALKVLVASESQRSKEAEILRHLNDTDLQLGKRFIPHLLEEFSIDGPNGRHICLVQPVAGSSIATAKEDSVNFMFPAESARSIAAQLIMGLSYLHSRGICHGDLHLRNFLLRGPDLNRLSPDILYKQYRLDQVRICKVDGTDVEPQAPSYAVYPLHIKMAADKIFDPIIQICDYGTSFYPKSESSPELHCPPLFLPPEDFFGEPITLAADVWTLGVSLYEAMGERPLFESFSSDRDDILADTISTLGLPPTRWWDQWVNRKEFFGQDGAWVQDIKRIYTPGFRLLPQRVWEMGRGETPDTCEWDVAGGEVRLLEELLKAMLTWEPAKRPTADQLLTSEYMVRWAMPAWERQLQRAES